jgi:SAM-dependent methyltransferase/uncharacterized protein YbaR (Trm112 family)
LLKNILSKGKDLIRRTMRWPIRIVVDTQTVEKKPGGGSTATGPDHSDERARHDAPTAPTPSPAKREESRQWWRFRELLACPSCVQGNLEEGAETLRCVGCSAEFPIVQGVPVLLSEPREIELMPFQHVSNQAPEHLLSWLGSQDGFTLNLGGGATNSKPTNCIELEYSIFRNTDVVGDAHRLPFVDGSFAAVLSLNTFEHLHAPATAARELYRVLQPGGEVYVQTAFLQPLHEEPDHFFNASEFGVREWFCDFDIEICSVPDNFSPAYSIAWLAAELLNACRNELGPSVYERLRTSALEEWASIWTEKTPKRKELFEIVDRLSDSATRRLAAGFDVKAKKPKQPSKG